VTLEARPQSLPLTVDEALLGTLALGVLEADGVRLEPLSRAFLDERDQLVQRLVGSHAGRQPSDIPGVAEARSLFHRLGIDPTKTRPSSEALLRRVLQGKGLPSVHPAVDVCNLTSLEHQLPLGLYDREKVRGAVRVRLGREGEGYDGIRKQRVHLAGRLLLADSEGPFGAPTSDSLRTSVHEGTSHLMVVFFCPVDRAGQSLSSALEHLAERLTRFCSAGVLAVRVIQ
jgi:DNA/RNA-binding domain of Phe-tRNA-synthetase-like protein